MPKLLGNLVVPTASSAPGSPVAGQVYYDTSAAQLKIYNGSAWRPANTQTVRKLQTWVIGGEIQVAVGQTNLIPPFYVSLGAGETTNLVEARYRIQSGTSATVKLTKNGSDISGFTALSATTTAAETTGSVALAENDEIALVVTAVSATPTNLTFTVVLESTI